jgi:DNA-binding response OmpR family regulator
MKTLLIVDDDPVFSLWCAEELEDDGYHTLRTTDGGKVMDMMSRHNPDLVLLDIRLGEYNGLDLLQKIRHGNYDIPIILCSAYASFKHDLRSIAADHYVVKSADPHDLKEKVKMCFEGMRTYEPQPRAIPQPKREPRPAGMPQFPQKVRQYGF